MRLQTRLLQTYSLLILLLVVALGISFYRYSASVFEKNAYSNLSAISEKISQQLDNLIRPMDFITTYMLSNGSFMSAMASLATLDRNNPRNLIYINEGWQTINSTLLSYSISKNFYSVNVFNHNGDFLSSNFNLHRDIRNVFGLIEGLPWLGKADDVKGRALILAPYIDPWSQTIETRVFGLTRGVQGPKGGMGYIEVQNLYSELEHVFSVPDPRNTHVVAVTFAGDVFYASPRVDQGLIDYYAHLSLSPPTISLSRNVVTGKEEIVAGSESQYAGIRMILAQDKKALLTPLAFTRNITFLLGTLIIVFSFLFNLLSSRQLTRPIRQLKSNMERTELGNLPDQITFESSNDEIEALNRSFQLLRARLSESMRREIESQSLEMQARFDFLQAQINPHFIYNVLTVLANKGMETGDEEICEICDGIAAMLRYSTSTTQRTATLGEEVAHVRTYLALMKKRFEHRLEYSIDVDEAILGAAIPKIVLQQIVENSISHGFSNIQKVMRISITGTVTGPRWRMEISDNGQGFDSAKLRDLRERISAIKGELSNEESRAGFAIGGMGLINTYARLALFYGSALAFSLENAAEGGAIVALGSVMGFGKENSGDDEHRPDRG
jgi:two-component system sensor histidine kinase YesM